ncbi:hypothetical protein [Caulobacter sp. S45]|uniref:hypothetical protein n=1 Tax=Caulobacter sp. S45 TaxID=1641861 RepID=UPI00131ADC0A|nr:hypothetical protein [Caulobacter sp. S45]
MARERARRPVKRRLRPAEVRRRKDTRRAIVILAVALVAVIGVGVLVFSTRTPELDPATGCIAGQTVPHEHTVVLIDQTDPLTSHQVDYVRALILAEYDRLRPYGELSIRGVRSDPDDAGQTFSRCRVRRGSEVSGVASNPEMIEQAFKRTVGDGLNSYLNSLRNVPTAPHSPIMEAVDSVVDGADFGSTVKARRLLLVSDMAQNSDLVSEYRGPGSGLDPDAQARETLTRDLHGVAVRIHYVRRPKLGEIQTSAQRDFWRQWFTGQGANVKLGWGLQLVDGRK